MGSIRGPGRPSGERNGYPLQYACLENPTDRGTCRAIFHKGAKSWTPLSTHAHTLLIVTNGALGKCLLFPQGSVGGRKWVVKGHSDKPEWKDRSDNNVDGSTIQNLSSFLSPGYLISLSSNSKHEAGGRGVWNAISQASDSEESMSEKSDINFVWICTGILLHHFYSGLQTHHRIMSSPKMIPGKKEKWKWKSFSRVQLFVTPWTVAHQAPLSMEFSRQECWSELPFPSPGDLPEPGIKSRSPALQVDSLLS